jgi:hypothetical protein
VVEFVPGRELARAFYEDVVCELVGDVPHSAALLGTGSDVLGFDTERSTDHGWGPRLQVFVTSAAVDRVREAVDAGLPESFHGWPTRYGWDDVPVTHHVTVTTLGGWLEHQLGVDPRNELGTVDWLAIPQQLLLEVTTGVVCRDDTGELERVRAKLAWYPDDVWRWLLGCQWLRIDQEEPFVGRAAEVGDELGSRLLGSRLARDVMRLSFLLERRYAPYSKWLGSAFARLDAAKPLVEPLARLVAAESFEQREAAWVEAVELLAASQNALGLTEPVEPTTRPFYSRPFRVLGARRFAEACFATVEDAPLRDLPRVGAIDQLVDSTDALSNAQVARRFRALYGSMT